MRLPLSFKDKSTYSQNQKNNQNQTKKEPVAFQKNNSCHHQLANNKKKNPTQKKQKIQDG